MGHFVWFFLGFWGTDFLGPESVTFLRGSIVIQRGAYDRFLKRGECGGVKYVILS